MVKGLEVSRSSNLLKTMVAGWNRNVITLMLYKEFSICIGGGRKAGGSMEVRRKAAFLIFSCWKSVGAIAVRKCSECQYSCYFGIWGLNPKDTVSPKAS
jgi:hypothetical protein